MIAGRPRGRAIVAVPWPGRTLRVAVHGMALYRHNRHSFPCIDRSGMRDSLTIAIGELYQGIRHEHWHGKTFRQFWDWFNTRCIAIVGAAEAAELEALERALLEVRAEVDDGGYTVPSDRLDEVIEPPM
jgi:hypothetical protein